MKFTALAVTTLVAVAGVASAADYQPALRALAEPAPNVAAGPAEHNAQPPTGANTPATKETTGDANGKKKELGWGPGFGFGGPWSGGWGLGGWGGYGGLGRWGWGC